MAEDSFAGKTTARPHPGLVLGVARFYYDGRGSIRGVLNSHPTEARLLAYAMISSAILLIGRVLQLLALKVPDITARILEQTVSLIFFLPLLYYGLAMLGTAIARMFGGQGSWTDGRTAFFWGALVSAPILVFANLGSILAAGVPGLDLAIGQIGAIFLAWALAVCFAEAFGFKSALTVLGVIVLASLGLVAGLWAMTA